MGLVYAQLARAGLGNELVVLAKAWLASRALGWPLAHTPWVLNRRGYWRYFAGVRPRDLAAAALRRTLPTFRFTEEAYRATGATDFGEAVARWAADEGLDRRRACVLVCEGLWGGLVAVDRAREYVRWLLLGGRHTLGNVTDFLARRRPGTLLVGVHVRRGDFHASGSAQAAGGGRWNVRVGVDWYVAVCSALRDAFPGRVQFAVFSDGSPGELAPLLAATGAVTTRDQRFTDCSDLVLLSLSDVLVCSPSSYSLVAAWLSGAPYLWPAHQCWREDGWLSLWGDEPAQRPPDGVTARNAAALARETVAPGRGVAVDAAGELPAALLEYLDARLGMNDRRRDLIYYGVVPVPAVDD